jgi:hypothetical protein
MPAARNIAPSSSVVVVFPFVPVTATNGRGASSRKPSSISLQTGMPRLRDERLLGGHAGALDQQPGAVEQCGIVVRAVGAVDAAHLDPPARERVGSCDAGACHAQHDRDLRQRACRSGGGHPRKNLK